MDKDEIKDMAIIISGSTELDTMNYYSARYKAKALIDAGYRKVGEDEIVVKKSKIGMLEKTIDYLEMEKAQLYKQREQAEQETREILQAINKYLVGTRGIYTVKTFRNCRFEDIMLVRADDLETLVKKLAKEHDIELEE